MRTGVLAALDALGRAPELYAVDDGRWRRSPLSNRVQAWTIGARWALEHALGRNCGVPTAAPLSWMGYAALQARRRLLAHSRPAERDRDAGARASNAATAG